MLLEKTELEIPQSSAINKIVFSPQNNSFNITFTSGSTQSYGTSPEQFDDVVSEFQNTKSVGKTYHKLLSSGILSVNGDNV